MLTLNKTNLRNLTILVGSTTTVLAATIISPILPEMTTVFEDVPNVELLVRLALTIPALFIALSAPFVGILLDKWGRRPVLIASLLLYAVAGSAGFMLDSLPAILASRALLGIAVAGIMAGFTTLILDYFSGTKLTQFMGYQGAFIGLGGMVFLLMAGFLAEIGWRLPFLIHLFALAILPGVIFTITEPQKESLEKVKDEASDGSRFPVRAVAPIYITAFVGMLVFFIFPVQLPFYLIDESGVSSSKVGLALSMQTLSSVFIALQYHRLKARFSFHAIFALVFAVLSINHLIIALTANYNLVMVGLLIGGLGIGLMPPNSSVWLASVISPEVRGRAVGGLTSLLFLGTFFTPLVTQPLVERFGISGMFGIASVASLVITAVFIGIAVTHSASRKDKVSINPSGNNA